MLDLLETSAVDRARRPRRALLGRRLVGDSSSRWRCWSARCRSIAAPVAEARRRALEYQRRRAVLESRQLELLHHTTELRALGAVDYGANEIAAISDSEHAIAMRAIRVALESSLVTEFLSGVSIGLVAMVVGFALLGGRISLEHALIAVLVTSEIFTHVRRYGVEFHRREDAERSLKLLDARRRVDDLVGATTHWSRTELVTAANDRADQLRPGPGSVTRRSRDRRARARRRCCDTLLGWRDPSARRRRAHRTRDRARERRERVAVGHAARQPHARRRDPATTRSARASRRSDSRSPIRRPRDALLADGRGISTGEKVRLRPGPGAARPARPAGHRRRRRACWTTTARRRVRDVLGEHRRSASSRRPSTRRSSRTSRTGSS